MSIAAAPGVALSAVRRLGVVKPYPVTRDQKRFIEASQCLQRLSLVKLVEHSLEHRLHRRYVYRIEQRADVVVAGNLVDLEDRRGITLALSC